MWTWGVEEGRKKRRRKVGRGRYLYPTWADKARKEL
jgi:hypothetical protein